MQSSVEIPLNLSEARIADEVVELLANLSTDQVALILGQVQRRLAEPEDGIAELPMFSRGIAGPLGKLEHSLKTKVDEHTHALFLRQCAMRNTDASSDLRDCVYLMVHGKSYRAMVVEKFSHEEKRNEALLKLIGPFGGPEFTE